MLANRFHRVPAVRRSGLVNVVAQAPKPRRAALLCRAASEAEIQKLTDLIMDAEGKLAALFEPGKPMPKAGVVAAMREQVSVLKTELATLMSGGLDSSSSGPQTAEEAAAKARQAFLEIERSLEVKYKRNQRVDDSAQIAMLEAENERLRYEAQAVLLRQQQLEDVMSQYGLRVDQAAFNSEFASASASAFVGASFISEVEKLVEQEEAAELSDSAASKTRFSKWR